MRQKRPPMRMCTGCGEMKPKKDLVRVVKRPMQRMKTARFWRPEAFLWILPAESREGALTCAETPLA